ncbi:hypothetical protein ACFV99_18735 [Streptomyces sp. NPDC059944]|uniref:hypothetical protein n=1 Tax=unclassified Streptomyces TaxID=2593676 RepID=UPI003653637D
MRDAGPLRHARTRRELSRCRPGFRRASINGTTYEGKPAIADWLGKAASEYTYTTQLTAAHRTDATHCTADHHLEGDFPGGQVDLRFRFTLRDGLIERLVIAP